MELLRRRGISPIVATALLILVVVAIGLMIHAFASGWVGGRLSEGVGVQTLLVVEEEYVDVVGDEFHLWIRNEGGIPTTIVRAYITYPNGSVFMVRAAGGAIYSVPPSDLTLDPGEVLHIIVEAPADLVSDQIYRVTVVSSDGSKASTTVRT